MFLNDKWEIVSGPHNCDFTLREWYEGKKRDGSTEMKHRDTYHPSIQQCVSKALKQTAIESVDAVDNANELITVMKAVENNILNYVEGK